MTPDTYDAVRTTVRHLRAQTIVAQLELIIVTPSAERLEIPPDDVAPFSCWRVVEVPAITALAYAKARAVPAATAPLIVFGEDHSFPEPHWAEALVAAYGNGCVGVAPQMKNANPESVLSWCAMFLHFGNMVEPKPAADYSRPAASHNLSYRREALLSLGDELGRLLLVEHFLLDRLRAAGHRVAVEPRAATRHVNMSRLLPALAQGFVGGRLFGGLRAEYGKWPALRRLLYAGGSPLVPLLRLRRVLGDIARTRHRERLVPRAVPSLLVLLTMHAIGEAVGYLFGVGNTDVAYSRYETRRDRHVSAPDRALFA